MKSKIAKCFCMLLIVTTLFTNAYAEGDSLNLSAPSAILMEASTGKVLYEKDADVSLPPASVTKVMTLLLTMEAIDSGKLKYTDMITGSARAKSMGGSTIFLDEGESLSAEDMIKGIAVASGNDASVAMAEHLAGSVENFVDMMNKRAHELGMKNTCFVNVNGLDADGHVTSARDIAIMSRELIKHEDIFRFTTIWMDSLRNGAFQLSNTNKLIRFYDGATGLKTGSTNKAKCCISATAKRNGMHLIAVVMASPTSKERFADASALLNYGFANYGVKNIINKGDVLKNVTIEKGDAPEVNVVAKDNFSYLHKKGDNTAIEQVVLLDESYHAPVLKDDVAGKVEFLCGGEKIGEVPLVFSNNVDKISFSKTYKKIFTSFVNRF